MSTQVAAMDWKPKANPWLIAVVVALAAFMEVLDTSIANVALPHISGNLGASPEQGTWVLTTYLVANAIVLPITGWFTSILGRKRFFLICIGIFSISSLLCGLAPNFGVLLLARALQGAGGGGMQPMAQAIMADSFPPRLRGMAFALFGITVVTAPALGPTLGGWITDNFTWRWIFLINLPVGLLAFTQITALVDDPPFLRRLKGKAARLDTMGLATLLVGVGALQIMLDKGQELDWFSSRTICTLAILSVLSLALMVVWEFHEKRPIVDVRLYRMMNFTTASAMLFLAGVISFTAGVLMPQYLQIFMGYSAQRAGAVVSCGAGSVLLMMPIIGILSSHVPAKYLLMVGWAASAASMFASAHLLTMQMSFGTAALMMIMQFSPISFIFLPSITTSYIGVPQDRTDAVSGLTNFMRNMGSSVGTSMVQMVLARRTQFHQARMVEHLTLGDQGFVGQVQGLAAGMQMQTAGVGMAEAQAGALTRISQFVMGQAATLSYVDAYMVLGTAASVMVVLSLLMKSNDPRHTEQHAAH